MNSFDAALRMLKPLERHALVGPCIGLTRVRFDLLLGDTYHLLTPAEQAIVDLAYGFHGGGNAPHPFTWDVRNLDAAGWDALAAASKVWQD